MNLTMPAMSHSRIYFFVFALIFIVCMVSLYCSGIYNFLWLENIVCNKQELQGAINTHYPLALLIFMILVLVSVAISLPLTFVLTTAGGSFFGLFQAVLLSTIATVVGALLAFLVVRYLLRAWLEKRYSKVIDRFDKNFNKQGSLYLLCMLLLPMTPFGIITLTAGLSDISALTFSCLVALGGLPSTVMYAFAGTQLAEINSSSTLLSWRMIAALVVLAAMVLVPALMQKYKALSHRD